MKITFEKKKSEKDHVVIVKCNDEAFNNHLVSNELKKTLKCALDINKKEESFIESFHFNTSNGIEFFTVAKLKNYSEEDKKYKLEAFGGRLFASLEKRKIEKVALFFEDMKNHNNFIDYIIKGMHLKSYKFEKYKKKTKKIFKVEQIKIIDEKNLIRKSNQNEISSGIHAKGNFLTRDLVSEPANILYPEKFVEDCKVLKKIGVSIDVLDEKKMRSLGMEALLGVSKGSVRPARVMIMKWQGDKNKKKSPIAFIGKGVTFDTGGISLKPSGGMEDMKWDMGGAAVVAGLMYTLASRKAKTNVIGAVGLVENMPDGNAQRPGDVVKSMSGQTIEVLNTDAEGRLVLADVLWYVKEKYKPKLMVDLATLTGAIIVALGDRYAGLFSNNDELSNQLSKASSETHELIWRLPLDKDFDKLLNCQIADMKNITGTRGAGSITAAQFLKRFVGDVAWAHLDIAGVTWSKKGTDLARPGGTGFGVRLLDNFVKNNYG